MQMDGARTGHARRSQMRLYGPSRRLMAPPYIIRGQLTVPPAGHYRHRRAIAPSARPGLQAQRHTAPGAAHGTGRVRRWREAAAAERAYGLRQVGGRSLLEMSESSFCPNHGSEVRGVEEGCSVLPRYFPTELCVNRLLSKVWQTEMTYSVKSPR